MSGKMVLAVALSVVISACPLFFADAAKGAGAAKKITVVIDPGHTKKSPGAISVRGIYEVEYNDKLAAKISKALIAAGYRAVLTRRPNQDITLEERVAVANAAKAQLLLSIHHDSAQLVYLRETSAKGKKIYRTRKPIAGYSIFISGENSRFDESYKFAEILGGELFKTGRRPTLHHAEMIPGESRPLLNERLGIYRYDGLVILKKPVIPAVLLEAGVIVDENDEEYVSRRENQDKIVRAVVRAVRRYDIAGR
jgi:N-acetylmuramoyl-L-alanine amidase